MEACDICFEFGWFMLYAMIFQFHPFSWKWHNFSCFPSWIRFHWVCMLHFLFPFIYATVSSTAINKDMQHLWCVLPWILQLVMYLNTSWDGVIPVSSLSVVFLYISSYPPCYLVWICLFLYLSKPLVFHRLFYLPVTFLLKHNQRKKRIFIWGSTN